METAEQSTRQFAEENDVLKQFMELLNQQNMGEQSQDFMELFKLLSDTLQLLRHHRKL